MHKYGIRHLSEYPPEERQWRLQNYSTFMFARNPYERTLSGYRNKMLEREWWFIRKYGRQIKRRFRGSQKGGRVRFDEFVRYLIKLDQNDGNFNMHWAKYHTICHPCEIDYDYIGKMETMNADADYIIRKFYGWRCPPKFPQKKGGHKTTNKVTSRWYSNLTQPLIDGLYKVYEKDFKLFGYDKIPPKIWLLWMTEIMVSVTLEPDLYINTLRPIQNCRRFTDDIFKYIFVNENEWISRKISLEFVLKVRNNNIPALVQIMAGIEQAISHYLN